MEYIVSISTTLNEYVVRWAKSYGNNDNYLQIIFNYKFIIDNNSQIAFSIIRLFFII
jgi:hypothetical protein